MTPARPEAMLWLSGHLWPGLATFHPRVGAMVTPRMRQLPPAGVWWAADTGLFNPATRAAFDFDAYLAWLDAFDAERRSRCLFVTAPDVVREHEGTWLWALWGRTLGRIRALGLPVAWIAQDGLQWGEVPWSDMDALFVGGSDDFKESVGFQLLAEAKARGVWAHQGRVNFGRRFRANLLAGADSCDGTLLRFGRDANLPRLERWLRMVALPFPGQAAPEEGGLACGCCGRELAIAELSRRDLWQSGCLACEDCARGDCPECSGE
jgi:hypothetical protein